MDFSSLKNILQSDKTSKYIIFDGENPSHIIISIEEYEKLLGIGAHSSGEEETGSQGPIELDMERGETSENKEVRIEDLPF